MAKILRGTVISTKMKDTVIVEVVRFTPHPLYKKLLKRGKKYKVANNGQTVTVGQIVKITETKPVSKDKYFKLLEAEK